MDLSETSIAKLHDRMAAGLLSDRDLAASYLQRIEQLDQRGPALRSMLGLNADALADAARLDDERAKTSPHAPCNLPTCSLPENGLQLASRAHSCFAI